MLPPETWKAIPPNRPGESTWWLLGGQREEDGGRASEQEKALRYWHVKLTLICLCTVQKGWLRDKYLDRELITGRNGAGRTRRAATRTSKAAREKTRVVQQPDIGRNVTRQISLRPGKDVL